MLQDIDPGAQPENFAASVITRNPETTHEKSVEVQKFLCLSLNDRAGFMADVNSRVLQGLAGDEVCENASGTMSDNLRRAVENSRAGSTTIRYTRHAGDTGRRSLADFETEVSTAEQTFAELGAELFPTADSRTRFITFFPTLGLLYRDRDLGIRGQGDTFIEFAKRTLAVCEPGLIDKQVSDLPLRRSWIVRSSNPNLKFDPGNEPINFRNALTIRLAECFGVSPDNSSLRSFDMYEHARSPALLTALDEILVKRPRREIDLEARATPGFHVVDSQAYIAKSVAPTTHPPLSHPESDALAIVRQKSAQ